MTGPTKHSSAWFVMTRLFTLRTDAFLSGSVPVGAARTIAKLDGGRQSVTCCPPAFAGSNELVHTAKVGGV